jgi:type II secretory pathway pseudopilin PulG
MMAEVHEHIIVEKRGGGMTMIIALLILGIVAVSAFFLVTKENRKDAAVQGAAQSVGRAADKVGEVVDGATAK